MTSETQDFLQTAHLLLGLTREELKRRIDAGLIDPEILKSQLIQSSEELKREVICENVIELKSLEQIDKFVEEAE